MAFTPVQAKSNSSVTTSVTVDSGVGWAAPTAGNLLVAGVQNNTGANTPTITGWTQIDTAPFNSTGQRVTAFYKIADGTETSIVANCTGASSLVLGVLEYPGVFTVSTLDKHANDGANSATAVTSQSTGTTASSSWSYELCVGIVGIAGSVTAASWNNSFTTRIGVLHLFMGDATVTALQTDTSTLSWTTARTAGGIIATFRGLLSPTAVATTTTFPAPQIVQSVQPGAVATTGSFPVLQVVQKIQPAPVSTGAKQKPLLVGLCDMGSYPFMPSYPWTSVSPYSGVVGSGDYSTKVLNADVACFWSDLQPTSQGQSIDLTQVPTITYISGQNEIGLGIGKGVSVARAISDNSAAGRGTHLRVMGGNFSPQWLLDMPCTDRNGSTAGSRSAHLVDGSGKHFPPFWSAGTFNPASPHSGFQGAYYDLCTQLAATLDNNPAVRAVTFSGSLTENTAEPMLRTLTDNVELANMWWFGLGESTVGAGDDTDTPAVQNLIAAHMAAWKYTPMSYSMGPNRRPSVTAVLTVSLSTGQSTVTPTGQMVTPAMNGNLISCDPTAVPAGTYIWYDTFALNGTGFLGDAVGNPINALRNYSGKLGVFNSTPFTTDSDVAQTVAAWAVSNYGTMFLGGNTSFNANAYWLSNVVHINWLMANQPGRFWLQTPITGNLNNEVQKIGFSTDGGVTTVAISTLGGSVKLSYAGQTSNSISVGGSGSTSLATNINTEINSGLLTTLKAEGAVAAASGSHFVTITWPSPPAERAGTVITMDVSAVTGASGLTSDIVVSQYEDTLVGMMDAAQRAGAAWLELHRGYESTTQPCATPSEMTPYVGTQPSTWIAPFPQPNIPVVILPTALATTATFPAPQVKQLLQPSAVSTMATFPTLQVVQKLQPSALASTATLPAFQVVQLMQPTALVSTTTFPAFQISQLLQPPPLSTTAAFPTLGIPAAVSPAALSTTATFPSMQVVQKLQPAAVSTSTAISAVGISASLTSTVLASTTTFPAAGISTSLTMATLVTTASFPASDIPVISTLRTIATTASFPTQGISSGLTTGVLSSTSSFPAPGISASLGMASLATTLSLPALQVVQKVQPSALGTTAGFPAALVPVMLSAVAIATTTSFPARNLPVVLSPAALATTAAFPVNHYQGKDIYQVDQTYYGSAGSGSTASSVSVQVPNNLTPGMVVFIGCGSRLSTITFSCPGFTAITATNPTTNSQPSTNNLSQQLLYRIVDGTEGWTNGSTVTVTASNTSRLVAGCSAWANIDVNRLFDPSAPSTSGQSNSSQTSVDAGTGPTTTSDKDYLIWFGFTAVAAGSTPPAITPPTGYTAEGSQINTTTGVGTGNNIGMLMAHLLQTTHGATGDVAGTAATASINGAMVFAITPFPTGPTQVGLNTSSTFPAQGISTGLTVPAIATTTSLPAPGISTGLTVGTVATTAAFPARQIVQILQSLPLPTNTGFIQPSLSIGISVAAVVTTSSFSSTGPNISVSPSSLATTSSFSGNVAVVLQPGSISTASIFSAPVAVVLQPSALVTTSTFGVSEVLISPTGGPLNTTSSFPSQAIASGVVVQPASLSTSMGLPVFAIGEGSTLSPIPLQTTAGFPASTPNAGWTVSPSSINTTVVVRKPTVNYGWVIAANPLRTVYAQMDIGLTLGQGSVVSPAALVTTATLLATTERAGSQITSGSVATTTTLNNPTLSGGHGVVLSLSSIATSTDFPSRSMFSGYVLLASSINTTTGISTSQAIAGFGAMVVPGAIATTTTIPSVRGQGGSAVVFPAVFPVQAITMFPVPTLIVGVDISPGTVTLASTFPGGKPPGHIFPTPSVPVGGEGQLVSAGSLMTDVTQSMTTGGMLINPVTEEDMVRTDRLLS